MTPGDIAIVVPCYNEANRLDIAAFERCAAAHPAIRFCFVDDGSTDNTKAVLAAACAHNPRFSLVPLDRNGGKGEAVRAGIRAVLRDAPAGAGYWDADLATPLTVIPALHAILQAQLAVDAVMGA